jgi:hypothetical protein
VKWFRIDKEARRKLTHLGPLCLLNRRVEPFVPASLALLWCFPNKEGRNTSPAKRGKKVCIVREKGLIPLVFAILCNGGLENLVLGVLEWLSEKKTGE